MYTEDDFVTRRDRETDDLIRQLLDGDNERRDPPCNDNDRGAEGYLGSKCRDNPHGTWGVREYPLAMMYAPIQEWRNLYDNEMGLSSGTIFRELELPFMGAWGDGSTPSGKGICGGCRNG